MFEKIQTELQPRNAILVAVSKTKPPEDIMKLYQAGHRVFGENRIQELVQKEAVLPKDIEWHMIGHLQTNKVKAIAPFISLIHAVESLKLLKEINKQALRNQRVIDCLLQFKIAREESKYGLDLAKAKEILLAEEFKTLQHIRIRGVMGMATFTSDQNQIRQEFKKLHQIFQELKENYFSAQNHFSEISMGMSNDYKIALEEGSTMVRIGSLIFGSRH